MTVFPGGKMALTTPDNLSAHQAEQVKAIVKAWLEGESQVLVIGACQVIVATRLAE